MRMCKMAEPDPDVDECIRHYFSENYTYREILILLKLEKRVGMSYRQLQRQLKRLNVRRRGCLSLQETITAIRTENKGSGGFLGCRNMAHRLSSRHGISLGRFSRRLLWLKVANTNNNPRVIASYFLDYVEEIEGVHMCIRMDGGTENGVVEDLKKAFRCCNEDDVSVIIGKSVHERIERWWRTLRQMVMGYWMDLFKDMAWCGTANPEHINCLRFCLMKIIQSELDQIQQEWKSHRIRSQGQDVFPPGKPDMMFYYPELYDTVDFKTVVDNTDVQTLKTVCEYPELTGCTLATYTRFISLLDENGRRKPHSREEAPNTRLWLLQQL